MAKITIDVTTCTGCGLCSSLCPEVFEIDDKNIAKVKGDSCQGQDINDVASQCPVEAIKVE
ncbi:MAG: ferredoxin [Candidatus Omnitrophica bacterium]|nr:ferredoxin [Candidatus Omnitrophota bacterium]